MTTDSKKYSTYDEFMECIADTLGKRKTKFVARMSGGKEPTYTKEELQLMRTAVERERKESEAMRNSLGLGASKIEHTQIGGETYQELKPNKLAPVESTGGRVVFALIGD